MVKDDRVANGLQIDLPKEFRRSIVRTDENGQTSFSNIRLSFYSVSKQRKNTSYTSGEKRVYDLAWKNRYTVYTYIRCTSIHIHCQWQSVIIDHRYYRRRSRLTQMMTLPRHRMKCPKSIAKVGNLFCITRIEQTDRSTTCIKNIE